MKALGVCGGHVFHRKLTSKWLNQALDRALEPTLQRRAKKLGAEIQEERGIDNAAAAIESAVGRVQS
jgi:UDP:flavonoid glycosyltransferase YjiC (YdhE family)